MASAYGLDLAVSLADEDLRRSPQAGLATVEGIENVAQALRLRLATKVGDLIMHPARGNRMWDMISDPITDTWYDAMRAACLEAVEDEPRSEVVAIEVAAIPYKGTGTITLSWALVDSPDEVQNLVFPFRLDGLRDNATS